MSGALRLCAAVNRPGKHGNLEPINHVPLAGQELAADLAALAGRPEDVDFSDFLVLTETEVRDRRIE